MSRSIVRGLVAGIGAGALAGLLDAARSVGSPNEMAQPADALAIVAFYAACFAPAGVLAAVVARRFEWPERMLDLLVAIGAGWFFVVAWANVSFLPGMTAGVSLAFDAVALVVALVLLRARYRSPGEDVPHTARWGMLALASAAIALVLPFVVRGRDDGPAPAAEAPKGAPRMNVLVYLVDTLRADHLSAWGYKKPTSPEVDAFAKDAVRFEDCRAPTSWTKPSVASLFTATYPATHQCLELREVLVPEAETLAEVFRAAGWRTAAFVDNPMVSAEFGFGQGFDRFDADRPSVLAMGTLLGKAFYACGLMSVGGPPTALGGPVRRGAAALHKGLFEFVDAPEREAGTPWFAYVHAMEPHEPYEPSREDAEAMGFPKGEPYAAVPGHGGILPFHETPDPDPAVLAKLTAQYDGAIRGWSRSFGAVLDGLRTRGQLERTVVVLVADHGEEFHEHGGWSHGQSLHRELVQVPLIVRLPDALGDAAKSARGRVVHGTSSVLDVAPTLYDVCGVRYPKGADPGHAGVSLASSLLPAAGKKPVDYLSDQRPVLGEVTQQLATVRSMREGRWLFVRSDEPLQTARALYDDVGDPGHKRNRIEEHAVEARELEAKMDEFFRRLKHTSLTRREGALDAETADTLRKLGYVR